MCYAHLEVRLTAIDSLISRSYGNGIIVRVCFLLVACKAKLLDFVFVEIATNLQLVKRMLIISLEELWLCLAAAQVYRNSLLFIPASRASIL